MTDRAPLDWLYGLQIHGIKLGLENMLRLCAALDVALDSGEKRKFIHVAGTNGKGSVCAMLAAMCVASRKRTGLYTSPHLSRFRERIRLGPHQIPEEHLADGLAKIREIVHDWEQAPTFFEVATALALSWFEQQHAEWIILETGLGGRLDATNVVTPVVSVLTPIGLDHTQHLGPTLAEVAREKAGIIKPGVPVISAPQPPEAERVFRETAARLGCPLNFISKPIAESWSLALAGSHQRMNAAVAFAALIAAGLRPKPQDIGAALAGVEWPGRFQRVREGRVILDGAHNPAAAERLAVTWREEFGEEKATLILGVLADKDARGICAALQPIAARICCVPVRSPRSLPGDALAQLIREAGGTCTVAANLADGLAQAGQQRERVLVAGSLFLVGEALTQLGLAEREPERSAQ